MIQNMWAIIDPKFDRPFFSNQPPPDTLVRERGACVVRYEIHVPEPTPVDLVCPVSSDVEARRHARLLFDRNKK